MIFPDHYQNQVAICKEAVSQKCSLKKVFLEISQNSQENTCARVSFNKVVGTLLVAASVCMQMTLVFFTNTRMLKN